PLPLFKRKEKLKSLGIFNSVIRLCPDHPENGKIALKKALKEGWSGVVAKDRNSAYRAGTSSAWLKIKGETSQNTPSEIASQRGPILTHLDKIFWPKKGITKGDLIEYYRS